MLSGSAALLVSFLAASAVALQPRPLGAAPPVASFEPLRYIGRWPQVYQSLSDAFESRYCVTADYGVFANGTVSVRNRERSGSVTGAQTGILGWAAVDFLSTNTASGSLSVNLQGPPFPAPYDIILLGPPTYGPLGLYQYAVVSDPFEISLFVLARNVTDYFNLYNQTVFDTLIDLGYTKFYDSPVLTYQDGCPEYSETDLWTCNVSD